jgi:hypothetical protein
MRSRLMLLAGLGVAVALGTAAPASAHWDDWRRREWRESQWRRHHEWRHRWHSGGWGPPPYRSYYVPPPPVYYRAPGVVYGYRPY